MIKFKAKSPKGEVFIGDLIQSKGRGFNYNQIHSHASGHYEQIDMDTLQVSTEISDKNENMMFVGDLITIAPKHIAKIVARSNYVAYKTDGSASLLPSLVISNTDGESIVELVQRIDGTWLKMNSIGVFYLELIKEVEET